MYENFSSEYGSVSCLGDRAAVLLTWKKPAAAEQFREPTAFALELMKKYPAVSLLIDLGDGFVPERDDAAWGLSFLLPELTKTACRKVALLTREGAAFSGCAEKWAAALGKYFAVWRAASAEEAFHRMEHLLWVDVAYVVKSGRREEFYAEIEAQNIVAASRQEPGNYRYDYSIPMDRANELWITELWIDTEAQKAHFSTEQYERLLRLKGEYVEQTTLRKYVIAES